MSTYTTPSRARSATCATFLRLHSVDCVLLLLLSSSSSFIQRTSIHSRFAWGCHSFRNANHKNKNHH